MKVLVDGIHLGAEMKGVGLYTAHTLREMCAIDTSVKFYVTMIGKTSVSLLPENPNIEYCLVPWRNQFWHGFVNLPKLSRMINPDVVWIPYETPVGLINKPYTIMCHDVPQEIRNAQGHWRAATIKERIRDKVYDLLLQRTFHKARIVYSNSKYVAQWLKEEKKINPFRLRLAPCAPGADFHKMHKDVMRAIVWEKLGTPEGYILVIYTGDPRENIGIIPEVFDVLVRQGIQVALVVAGVRDSIRSYVTDLFSTFPWRDRVRLVPFLPADKAFELTEVYTAALAYLEPSLHEGFGMQVVEAMSCGVPVVCSDRGALPEVVGEAALMVSPVNALEISEALISVLADDSLKEKLVSKGYERASHFDWNKTAWIIYNGLTDACGHF